MLRGRIVAARGVKAEDLKASSDSEWVLQSDRGLTYTSEIPKGSKLVEGQWWAADYDGPPLVSLEKKIADGLKLKIGDQIVVNVLGRDITATISNMRTVDWQSLGINFVLVFSPNAFKGAPHTHIATLTEPHPCLLYTSRSRQHRQRDISNPQRGRCGTGQTGRRRRFRPAIPDQRNRLARHRAVAARQPGALDLSGQAAGQRGRQSRRHGAGRRCQSCLLYTSRCV